MSITEVMNLNRIVYRIRRIAISMIAASVTKISSSFLPKIQTTAERDTVAISQSAIDKTITRRQRA